MNQSRADLIRKKVRIKPYLEELGSLLARPVLIEELKSLEETQEIREKSVALSVMPVVKYEMAASDIDSLRFQSFLGHLTQANSSSIYIWLDATIDCGILLAPSLISIEHSEFTVGDRVFVFLTQDFRNRLLVDSFIDEFGEKRIKLEISGNFWSKIVY